MKFFKGSKYEDDLNNIWNKKACASDTKIRMILKNQHGSIGDFTELNALMETYKKAVKQILKQIEILENKIRFNDHTELEKYKRSTITAQNKDFEYYERTIDALNPIEIQTDVYSSPASEEPSFPDYGKVVDSESIIPNSPQMYNPTFFGGFSTTADPFGYNPNHDLWSTADPMLDSGSEEYRGSVVDIDFETPISYGDLNAVFFANSRSVSPETVAGIIYPDYSSRLK